MNNIFSSLPDDFSEEIFENIVRSRTVRIERILSKGHTTPEQEWYDQEENEWVLVLQGAAKLLFDDGREVDLKPGDFINIPSRSRHRVSWSDPNEITIWLAVFY